MNWLRFNLERLLLRGVGYRLLFAALVIATISLLVGAAMSLHPAFTGPLDAIWWAFLRLTDTGYLGDDEGASRRVVSTLLTVAGAVVFIGLLVAILTQWMGAWLQKVEGGLSPLRIRGHILEYVPGRCQIGVVILVAKCPGEVDHVVASVAVRREGQALPAKFQIA